MAIRLTIAWDCCGATQLTGFNESPNRPDNTPRRFGAPVLGQRTADNPFGIQGRNEKTPKVRTVGDKLKEDIEAKLRSFPRHMFSCVLNSAQYDMEDCAWPKLLKALGFVPTVLWQNAVHPGRRPLVMFTLVGNTGAGAVKDPYGMAPPNWDKFSPPSKEGEVKAAA